MVFQSGLQTSLLFEILNFCFYPFSTAMMMLQEGANPNANIHTRVTKQQLENWQKNVEKYKFKWDASFVKPTDTVKTIFSYTLRNNWKDLAYIMLEVSKLPMFDALKVSKSFFCLHMIFFDMHKF